MTTEVEWRRKWKATLASKSWQPLRVGGTTYLIKSCFHHAPSDLCYEFLITDRVVFWHEEIEEVKLRKRAKRLNPSVEAPASKLLTHIEQQIQDQPKGTQFEITTREDGDDGDRNLIQLTVTSRLAGLPFIWTFNASPAHNTMVSEHATVPLLIMIQEQQRRENELFKMLTAKDREIDDLRAQGAKSTRRHLETGAFDETVFCNNMDTSKGFEDAVKEDGQSAFGSKIQELYRRIMDKKAWLVRPPTEEEDGESLMDEESVAEDVASRGAGQSWTNRIPGSAVSASSTNTSPNKSPTKSPAKSPAKSSDTSPTKDTELLRRQALERRLQEEEIKKDQSKAKKKKKIKF